MKRFLIILLSLVPLLSMAQDDDMYFTSRKKKAATRTTATGSSTTRSTYYNNTVGTTGQGDSDIYTDNSTVSYNNSARSDDEYNRRYAGSGTASDGYQQGNGSSTDYDEEDLTNADNNEVDYRYSRRLLRFHSPNVVVTISSPYYWDLVYDCGVYDKALRRCIHRREPR